MTLAPRDQDIKHVVLLVLENRSFDQMLGCFQQIYGGLDGISPPAPPRNNTYRGVRYEQRETTLRQMWVDPHHEVDNVKRQLAGGNQGFVEDFAMVHPDVSPDAYQFIMGYYPMDFLPALHTLARHFTICDHWFASVPGPTWPNRFFGLTGTAEGAGRKQMPPEGAIRLSPYLQTQPTIFDRLNKKGIHWRVYFHDVPQTWMLERQRTAKNIARYFYFRQFLQDAAGSVDAFPQFSLIEPDYIGYSENDDHPPHDVMKAENLLAHVYNAIRANDELWKSTLLIVYFDEHGGFYDHVPPPPSPPEDQDHKDGVFDTLGVRVPALLVSPYVAAGVVSEQFDHTSVLKYLIDKWGLEGLGPRVEKAKSIEIALLPQERSQDSPVRITLSNEQRAPPDFIAEEKAFRTLSWNQIALRKLAANLDFFRRFNPKIVGASTYIGARAMGARVLEWAGIPSQSSKDRRTGVRTRKVTDFQATIAEPGQMHDSEAWVRDDIARFLMTKKRESISLLAEEIRRRGEESSNDNAIRTLAAITGRPFDLVTDKARQREIVERWLSERGY